MLTPDAGFKVQRFLNADFHHFEFYGLAVPSPHLAMPGLGQGYNRWILVFFQPGTLNPWPRPGSDVNAFIPMSQRYNVTQTYKKQSRQGRPEPLNLYLYLMLSAVAS